MIFETPSKLTKLIYFINNRNGYLFSIIRKMLNLVLHIEISPRFFKLNLQLIHPYNIIIHPQTNLGNNITIYNNVTIGSIDRHGAVNTPTIGNSVIIYPYSVIVGNIKIGNYSLIKPGSVVERDVPEFSVVGGNPASVLKTITIDDYNDITVKEIQEN